MKNLRPLLFFGGLGRNNLVTYIAEFEDYQASQNVEASEARTVDAQTLLDLQLGYDVSQQMQLVVGGTNVLDDGSIINAMNSQI